MTNPPRKFKKGDKVILLKYTTNGKAILLQPTGDIKLVIDTKEVGEIRNESSKSSGIWMYTVRFSNGNTNYYETELELSRVNNWKNRLGDLI